ncbi:MAG: AsmA family protein, partial [Thermodesulfobacteriota bacterium]
MNISRFLKKYLKSFIFILLIFLVLFLIINLGLREIINSGSIRGKIHSTITEKTNSDFKYDKIKVYLIPTPHINVYNGDFSHNKNFVTTCKFESVDIYLKVFPLLLGHIKVKNITINKPKILIDLPKHTTATIKKKPGESSFLDYLEKYYNDLIAGASKLPEINLQIKNGELVLYEDGKEVLYFHRIKTKYKFDNKLKYLKFSGNTNFADLIKFEGTISPDDLKSSFDLYFKSLDPDKLTTIILSDSPYITDNSKMDLDINLEFDGSRKISGDIKSSNFSLNLINKDKFFSFKGKNLYGDFKIDDDEEFYSIKKIKLENPELNLSAEFQNDKKKEIYNLKILGNEVDVKTTGEMALFSLNNLKITEKIFQVLKAGKFESIEFYSESEKLDKLFKDSNINIKGKMKDGIISV